MQLGKSLSIALILLGIYLIYNLIFHSFSNDPEDYPPRPNQPLYHIGCYDIQRPLKNSQEIRQHLYSITNHNQNTSEHTLALKLKQVGEKRVRVDKMTDLARQFEKYIATYQHIKSHSQHQQAYYTTLRQAREAFSKCRQEFNELPWNCDDLSLQYNKTGAKFQGLKQRLVKLIDRRGKHQEKYQEILREQDIDKDQEYNSRCNLQIQTLNEKLNKNKRTLKDNSESLNTVQQNIANLELSLNRTQRLLSQCQTNRQQIEFCKKISEYVTQIYGNQQLQSLQKLKQSLENATAIIKLLKNSLYQSKKLGQNVSQLEINIANMERDYQELFVLYQESRNSSKCSLELQIQCEPETVDIYQLNITQLTKSILDISIVQSNLQKLIGKTEQEIGQLQTKIKDKEEQMKNNVVGVDFLKNSQARKRKQVQDYRLQLNQIMIEIAQTKAEISDNKLQRQQQNIEINKVMIDAEKLIDCLAKKNFYMELLSRVPQNRAEDEYRKREGSERLRERIRATLNK